MYIQTIETQKTAYLNLLSEYNKQGEQIQFRTFDQYTAEAQKNIRDSAKLKHKSDALVKADKLKSDIFKTLLEVQNSLLKTKYPMLTSAESAINQNRLLGTLELNNASTDLNRLQDVVSNSETIFSLLDNAIRMNRIDYMNALIDAILSSKSIDVEILDTSIILKPTDKNVKIYQSEQDFYSRLNDYRLGLKNFDNTLAQLYLENKESLFLSENITVLIKVLQPNEPWLSHIFSGYELTNITNIQSIQAGSKDSMKAFEQINAISKYYSQSRQNSFMGIK